MQEQRAGDRARAGAAVAAMPAAARGQQGPFGVLGATRMMLKGMVHIQ